MIERPSNLVVIAKSVTFNFLQFKYLEVDIEHINKNGRANFDGYEVARIFEKLVSERHITASMTKVYGDEACSYFVKTGFCKGRKFKVVFCICSDKPNCIGIITLHRV